MNNYELDNSWITKFKEEDNIDSARLVLKDIDLKTFISEIILWDKFFDIIKLLKNISAIRCKNNDYQYWLIDTSNNSAINIAFAVNEKITIDLLASSLKTFLNGEIFEKKVEEKKDKIILVGWDTENLRWMSDII